MDNTLKILNFLGKNIRSAYTMHNLSSILNIPYATFHRTIKEMDDLIIKENVGKSTVIRLNLNNKILEPYLIISSEKEKKEYLKKRPIINKICSEIVSDDIVALFGSYAKGEEKKHSDIDLLIVNNDGKKSISFLKYELLFKKQINPIFITKNEFRLMLRENEENLGKQVLKYHIILNNSHNFWELVLDAI